METPFDYFFDDRTNPRTIEALKGGPLASALEAYARCLHEDGYATHSGFVQLRLLGCFNRWLDRKGLTSEDVDAATIERVSSWPGTKPETAQRRFCRAV